MDSRTKERVGPLTRRQCDLMINFIRNGVQPNPDEIKEAGFPFFENSLPAKAAYSKLRFKAWASKLEVTPAGVLVFAETGKELLPTEDIEEVVMNLHCDGSEGDALSHRKLHTIIRKMKEKYSLKRRAFGPAEALIRSIVHSCPEPNCKFNVISHSKQRINVENASLAEESNDIANFSASSVQGSLETIGLNSVSPSKNALENVATCEKTKGPHYEWSGKNYSAELYSWIGPQIAQSTKIQQCTSESDFSNPLLLYKSDHVSEPGSTSYDETKGFLGSLRSAPCTSSPKALSERSLSIPGSGDCLSFPLEFAPQRSTNTSNTFVHEVPVHSAVNAGGNNGEKNSQFVGLNNKNVHNHLMELHNWIRPQIEQSLRMQQQGTGKVQNPAQLNHISSVPDIHRSTPSEFTDALYSQYHPDHEAKELISSFVSKLKTGNSNENGDTSEIHMPSSVQQAQDLCTFQEASDLLGTGTLPNSYKFMGSGGMPMNQGSLQSQNTFHIASDQSKRFLNPESQCTATGSVQGHHDSLMRPHIPRSQQDPIHATDMPGDPTMSSQIFSVDQPRSIQPICSQASGTNRIILPNELPHIYPVIRSATLPGQPDGPEVTKCRPVNNYKYMSQELNLGKRTSIKRSSQSDWGYQEPPKKSKRNETNTKIDARWERRSIDTKSINSQKELGIETKMSTNQNTVELRGQTPPEEYLVGSDAAPHSIPCMTISSEKTENRNQHEQDSHLPRKSGQLVDTYVTDEDSSQLGQHSSCPKKGKLTNEKDLMELWQEMREKCKKDKLKQKFDIIDKIQRMVRKKSRKFGRDERNKDRNTAEGRPYSTSLGKSKAFKTLLAKVSHLSGSYDEMSQPQSTTVSDVSDNQRNLKHILHPTHGEFQSNNMLWSRTGSFSEISTRELSFAKQKKRRGRPKSGVAPRPPPAHTGSPVLREFVNPYKVTAPRKRNGRTSSSDNEPLDLSVSPPLTGRPKPVSEQALDLSVKASRKGGNARKKILSMSEQRPTNENIGDEAGAVKQDDTVNRNAKQPSSNECAPNQYKRDIMETCIGTNTASTDDDTEVASLHVSLYMKTLKIARAQVTSSTLSPYFETSTKVKEHKHGTRVNFTAAPNETASTRPMTNTVSFLPSTSCKESNLNNNGEETTQSIKNCSPPKQGKHVIPVADKTRTLIPAGNKGQNGENLPRKYTKTSVFKSHSRVPRSASKSFSARRNEFSEVVATADTSKSIGFSNSQRQTYCRLEKPRCNRVSECASGNVTTENIKTQRRVPVTVSTPTPLGEKSKLENIAKTGRYEAQFPVATPTKTGKTCTEMKPSSLNKCTETKTPSLNKKYPVDTHTKCRGGKRVPNGSVTSGGVKEHQDLKPAGEETNDIEVIEDQPSRTKGRMDDSFNVTAFLKTKEKEAFEIKLKETERKKKTSEKFDKILQHITQMREQYRPCLLDLQKTSLDKLVHAIQKIQIMVRDCKSSLQREEAALSSIKGLEDPKVTV